MEQQVPIDQLKLSDRRPAGRVPTDTPSSRRRLQETGFEKPIPVRPVPGQARVYEVLGEVRPFLSAMRLGVSQVPVLIMPELNDVAATQLIHTNYQPGFSDKIEEAEVFKEKLDELAEFSDGDEPNIAAVARYFQKSRTYVSRLLSLLELDPRVQEMIRDGLVSTTHARYLKKVKNCDRQSELAERVKTQNLSERALAKLVNRKRRRPSDTVVPSATTKKDADIVRLEQRVTELIGSPFEIDHPNGVCTIRYFGNLETLQGVLEKLGYRE